MHLAVSQRVFAFCLFVCRSPVTASQEPIIFTGSSSGLAPRVCCCSHAFRKREEEDAQRREEEARNLQKQQQQERQSLKKWYATCALIVASFERKKTDLFFVHVIALWRKAVPLEC